MATLTEVWIDDYVLMISAGRGPLSVSGTAATFDASGQRVRVGTADITDRLSPEALAAIDTLVAEVKALVLEQCGIDEADLLPEAPFPPPPEPAVPPATRIEQRMF